MTLDTENRLRQTIAEHLGLDEMDVTPDAHFAHDLSADSVDVVELIVALEDEYQVSFTDEQRKHIRTLRAATTFVLQNTRKEPALWHA
jgi:acyl carrier protein